MDPKATAARRSFESVVAVRRSEFRSALRESERILLSLCDERTGREGASEHEFLDDPAYYLG
jgi:hypothetical protein